jgi:cell division septum initiation protein DivIVA
MTYRELAHTRATAQPMANNSGHELKYSLQSLPRKLFRGYDPKATEQLFGRINANYGSLHLEWKTLAEQFEELQKTATARGEAAQSSNSDLQQARAELEAIQTSEQSLRERLDRAKAFMDDEIARVRSEATADLERVRTQSAAELERVQAQSATDFERIRADAAAEIESIRAESKRELEFVRGELTGYEKRETLVKDMLDAAKRTAESIREDARADAELLLKKAREREAKIVGEARRENNRLEQERKRLMATAAELREDLSAVLTSTLEQLTPETVKPQKRDVSTSHRARTPRRSTDLSGSGQSQAKNGPEPSGEPATQGGEGPVNQRAGRTSASGEVPER